MLDLTLPGPDRILLRYMISLSLLSLRPFRLREGYRFIDETPPLEPLVRDWKGAVAAIGAGAFAREGGDLVFTPMPVKHGNYELAAGPRSSAVEVLLLLAPAFFNQPYRSSLSVGGVTHSGLSGSTGFVRETLFALLEQMGFYAGLTLRRFGFSGTGGGRMEAKIYPAEMKRASLFRDTGAVSAASARIYTSRLPAAAAQAQKGLISERLGVPGESIGIIEVLDCDGPGNCVEISMKRGGETFVLSRVFDITAPAGGPPSGVEALRRSTGEFLELCEGFARSGNVPLRVLKELVPYLVMSGSEAAVGESVEGFWEALSFLKGAFF